MRKSVHLPDSYKQVYEIEKEGKTFQQFKQTYAERQLLPNVVRIEQNNGYNSIKGADALLRVRNATNWKKCSITGLRPTQHKTFYYGDFKVNNVKSLVIVHVVSGKVEVRVCCMFYPIKKGQLHPIVNHIIKNF